jgi:hypothetical protein
MVTVTEGRPEAESGSTVSVQVTYNFSFADPLVPSRSLTFNTTSNGMVAQ